MTSWSAIPLRAFSTGEALKRKSAHFCGQTKTSIRELKAEESTDELARILGGAKITDTVRQNAKEMQELAAQIKK